MGGGRAMGEGFYFTRVFEGRGGGMRGKGKGRVRACVCVCVVGPT